MKSKHTKFAAATSLGVLTASQAYAAIEVTTENLILSHTGADGTETEAYLDVSGTGAIQGSASGADFTVRAGINSNMVTFDLTRDFNQGDKDYEVAVDGAGSNTNQVFSLDDQITTHSHWSDSVVQNLNTMGNLSEGEFGFFGLRFPTGQHGWVSITLTDTTWNGTTDSTISATVHELGITTAGEAILAGQGGSIVPEPSTAMLLLAAGAAGLALYRRRNS